MADIVKLPQRRAGCGASRGPVGKMVRPAGQVQSLTRALRLMNCLCEHAHGLTLSEMAQTVGLPTSTAHRLLTTLQNEQYVRFDTERSVWLIGVQAFQVGASFIRSRDLVSVARPYMRRLMESSGETSNLAISDNGEIVYLAQVECHKVMRAITRPGGRAKIHNSAVGKALLSRLPDEEVERLIRSRGLERETKKTIVSMSELKRALRGIRKTGYAVDDEEAAVGMRCIASVIFDENGETMAALSVSGPVARIPKNRVSMLGIEVLKIAREITAQLGGKVPDDQPRY